MFSVAFSALAILSELAAPVVLQGTELRDAGALLRQRQREGALQADVCVVDLAPKYLLYASLIAIGVLRDVFDRGAGVALKAHQQIVLLDEVVEHAVGDGFFEAPDAGFCVAASAPDSGQIVGSLLVPEGSLDIFEPE